MALRLRRDGSEFHGSHSLRFVLRVNTQNQLLVKDIHRSVLLLVTTQGLVKVGSQNQARSHQFPNALLGLGLRALVHSKLNRSNQTLRHQQRKILLEVARQAGSVSRYAQQLLFLVDLARILERQSVEKEMKVLMTNLREFELL